MEEELHWIHCNCEGRRAEEIFAEETKHQA